MTRALGWQTGAFSTRKPGKQAALEREGPVEPAEQEQRRIVLRTFADVVTDGGKIRADDLLRAGVFDRETCALFHVRYDPKVCVTCWTTWCGGPPCGNP